MFEVFNIVCEIVFGMGMNVYIDVYSVSCVCVISFQVVVNVVESLMVGIIWVGIVGGVDFFLVLLIGVSKKLVCVLVDVNKVCIMS